MGGRSPLAPLCREARGGGRLLAPFPLVPRREKAKPRASFQRVQTPLQLLQLPLQRLQPQGRAAGGLGALALVCRQQLLAANQSQSAQATGGATLRLEALERQLQELQRRLDALE